MATLKKVNEEEEKVTREEMDRRFEVEKEEASTGFAVANSESGGAYKVILNLRPHQTFPRYLKFSDETYSYSSDKITMI